MRELERLCTKAIRRGIVYAFVFFAYLLVRELATGAYHTVRSSPDSAPNRADRRHQ